MPATAWVTRQSPRMFCSTQPAAPGWPSAWLNIGFWARRPKTSIAPRAGRRSRRSGCRRTAAIPARTTIRKITAAAPTNAERPCTGWQLPVLLRVSLNACRRSAGSARRRGALRLRGLRLRGRPYRGGVVGRSFAMPVEDTRRSGDRSSRGPRPPAGRAGRPGRTSAPAGRSSPRRSRSPRPPRCSSTNSSGFTQRSTGWCRGDGPQVLGDRDQLAAGGVQVAQRLR